jgi:hypothetical protein
VFFIGGLLGFEPREFSRGRVDRHFNFQQGSGLRPDLLEHDGPAVILNLERKGYGEQLRLAALDLLRLKPIEPFRQADPYGVIPGVPRPLDMLHEVTVAKFTRS